MNDDIKDLLDELEDTINDLNNPYDIETIQRFLEQQRSIYGRAVGECAS